MSIDIRMAGGYAMSSQASGNFFRGSRPLEMSHDQINETLAFYFDQGVDIRLKTCHEWVSTGNPDYPKRAGMFTMDKDEHLTLQCSGGYYLFLVKDDNHIIIAGRLLPVNDITFKKQKHYREVFDG